LRTLILGLGNPILTDDAVGLHVARRLHKLLGDQDVDLVEAAVAGLQSVDLISRYDRAVIIDAVPDGEQSGKVWRIDGAALESGAAPSSHGIGLGQALRLARELSMRLPEETILYAIAVVDPYTFGEGMTPQVEQALPGVVQEIATDLARLWGRI